MKQPKKLTRAQKQILSDNDLDATKYELLKEDNLTITVITKSAKKEDCHVKILSKY